MAAVLQSKILKPKDLEVPKVTLVDNKIAERTKPKVDQPKQQDRIVGKKTRAPSDNPPSRPSLERSTPKPKTSENRNEKRKNTVDEVPTVHIPARLAKTVRVLRPAEAKPVLLNQQRITPRQLQPMPESWKPSEVTSSETHHTVTSEPIIPTHELTAIEYQPADTAEAAILPEPATSIEFGVEANDATYREAPMETPDNLTLDVETDDFESGLLGESEAAAQPIDSAEYLPITRETIVMKIAEVIDVQEPQLEKSRLVLSLMPEAAQTGLAEYLDENSPEVVEAAAELIIHIAEAADRLQVLAVSDKLEGEKAIQIKQLLVEWYKELLDPLELEADEVAATYFIDRICSKNYGKEETKTQEIFDELRERLTMHKLNPDVVSIVSSLVHFEQSLQLEVARLMVYHSADLKNPVLAQVI